MVPKLRDAEAPQKVAAYIKALGGSGEIERVDVCAETRLRVVRKDGAQAVDEQMLLNHGVVTLSNQIMHLIVGFNADQYAAEMNGQLKG